MRKQFDLSVKHYTVSYGTWVRFTPAQQQAYLDQHNLQFRGYVLTGPGSTPCSIEFIDKSVKE